MDKLDKIRGCLVGGAAGDALGYTVEFMMEDDIFSDYGESGISEYELKGGIARISDDTQMSMFTAVGMLVHKTVKEKNGEAFPLWAYVDLAYRDWLATQRGELNASESATKVSWLLDVASMYASRAPGGTCISAMSERVDICDDYLSEPINSSKGCGGIMRVAPLALGCIEDITETDIAAIQCSAITHGHPLGYAPSAVLTHIISRIMDADNTSLKDIVCEARDAILGMFSGIHVEYLGKLIDMAIYLSEKDTDDLSNIHFLGEGWVAEETLAIAIYCALKYSDDFSKAICVSVNHKGDSDSTGAVTGNILGAYLGYDAIDDKWKKKLEHHELLLELAADISTACEMNKDTVLSEEWLTKYVERKRYR